MRTIKCPVCQGNGEYKAIQTWGSKEYKVPVNCNCDNGVITWSEYCAKYRRKPKNTK